MAQRAAPQVIQAEGNLRSANAAVRSAYGAFVPSLSLSAGANRQFPSGQGATRVENGQVITLASEPWSYSGNLGASVDLFSGGQRFFDLQQARQSVVAARANQVTQRYAVVLAAKQQFFNVLAARESESAARAQLDQAEQQRRTALLKVRAKTATRSDSLRAEIQVRDAQLALLTAERDLTVANAGLTRAVGSESPVTAANEELPPPALSASDESLRHLAAGGPTVQEARANLSAASAARHGTWGGYLPSVSASYGRVASGTDPNFGLGTDDYSYSGSFRLSLSLPIFDHFQREAELTRAKVGEDNAKASLRDAELAANQTLAQALGAFRVAEQQVQAQTATVEAAEEDLRVQQQRYAVGGSTLLDVLTSQTELTQARRALIRARYDQRIAKAQLEALVGHDL
jgi:outer membrane protein